MSEPVLEQGKLQPYRKEAFRCLAWIFIWLVVAVGVLVVSSIPALVPSGQTLPSWFQRSGSITTIAAVVIGLFVGRIEDRLQGKFMGSIYGQEVFKEVRIPFKCASWSALGLTVIGTLVWGYGDLVAMWLCGAFTDL